jgi:hypothetical protein
LKTTCVSRLLQTISLLVESNMVVQQFRLSNASNAPANAIAIFGTSDYLDVSCVASISFPCFCYWMRFLFCTDQSRVSVYYWSVGVYAFNRFL